MACPTVVLNILAIAIESSIELILQRGIYKNASQKFNKKSTYFLYLISFFADFVNRPKNDSFSFGISFMTSAAVLGSREFWKFKHDNQKYVIVGGHTKVYFPKIQYTLV